MWAHLFLNESPPDGDECQERQQDCSHPLDEGLKIFVRVIPRDRENIT